jgi:glycosyltransferase involved in cell wall biosynthesis
MAAMLHRQGFQHLRIWPRGVDTVLFQPERRSQELPASWLIGRKRPDDTTVLLYVGRISWEKNLRLLAQAYRVMDHERCHLVIVGDGPALNEVQQDLADLPVTFTGYLQGEQLANAYASADIFAFPSTSETFGQVVLEAMACGLPVVGVHSEGVCDLVQDEYTGILLDIHGLSECEQVHGYRTRLQRLINRSTMRQAMGQAGLLEARQRSWPEAMDRLLHGYHEVIVGKRPLIAA